MHIPDKRILPKSDTTVYDTYLHAEVCLDFK